jgi:folate-binding protein YgfZ
MFHASFQILDFWRCMSDIDLTRYRAAQQGAAFYLVPDPGFLRIAGNDQQAFLQRQTTNDIRMLKEDRALITCLTSPLARILDVLYLIKDQQSIGIVTLPKRGAATAAYLRSRIFFMDKVTLEDFSLQYFQLDLLGPLAGEVLRNFSMGNSPTTDGIRRYLVDGMEWYLWALDPSFSLGYRALIPIELQRGMLGKFVEYGANSLGEEEYDILRVESGLPAAGRELSEDFTPFEVGLQSTVSDQKGCYTGQEVLARQVTYDKVTQRLVGLKLEAMLPSGVRFNGEDGKPAGVLTSCVNSPTIGVIGLGVVKRPYDQEGTRVQSVDGAGISGQIVKLPFL